MSLDQFKPYSVHKTWSECSIIISSIDTYLYDNSIPLVQFDKYLLFSPTFNVVGNQLQCADFILRRLRWSTRYEYIRIVVGFLSCDSESCWLVKSTWAQIICLKRTERLEPGPDGDVTHLLNIRTWGVGVCPFGPSVRTHSVFELLIYCCLD